jgi:site-specific DNA-cytosine methylase
MPRSGDLVAASLFAGVGGSSLGYRSVGFRVVYANEFSPHASGCYALNMDRATKLDASDVREVKAAAFGVAKGELDLLDGSPPCFTAEALIMTKAGLRPITDVKIGDLVLTHRLRWRRVTNTSQRRAETIKLKGQGHPGLATTNEHPFWVRQLGRKFNRAKRRYDRAFGNPEWIGAGKLRPDAKGHHQGGRAWFWSAPSAFPKARVPLIPTLNKRSHIFNTSSAALMWVVGAWLGDGWLRTGPTSDHKGTRGEVLICSSKAEAPWLEASLRRAGLRFSSRDERTTRRFAIMSKPFAIWLEKHFGRYSGGKRLPAWAYGMHRDLREALLSGYRFADGTEAVQVRGGCPIQRFSTVNKGLAIGFRLLAGTLGKSATIMWSDMPTKKKIEGRIVNQRGFYQLTIYDRARSAFAEGGMFWGKIRSIAETGIVADVFNIEVEEDNSYVADGIVVHNCQAFSMSGKRAENWGKERRYAHGATQRNEDLFFEFVRLRDEAMPRAFVAENVPGLVKGVAKGYFLDIMRELRRGYRVEARLLDAQWLGVPQARQRLVFVGIRDDLGMDPVFPEPQRHRISVKEALPGIAVAWRDRRGAFGNSGDMTNKPAPTVLADSVGTHWVVDVGSTERRKMTIDELKVVCGFPRDYKMDGSYAEQWKGLGNCVPPPMTAAIGAALRDRVLLPARAAARIAARGRRSTASSKSG